MTPLKLTEEVADKIVSHLKMGNGRETAAAVAKVDPRTLRRWLGRASLGEEPYASFADRCREAEAVAEARYVGVLFAAARNDWRAAAWVLARKYPERWGDRVQLKIEEGLQQILDIAEAALATDEFGRLLTALAEGKPSIALGHGEQGAVSPGVEGPGGP